MPEESEVRFTIYEELRGQPKDVVGVSDQVAGEIAVLPGDLSALQVGTIQVNARTLVTDESQRNQAIRNRILNTDTYEFITFTPTEIIGLSGSGELGQTVTFQVAGDMTIRNVTRPVGGGCHRSDRICQPIDRQRFHRDPSLRLQPDHSQCALCRQCGRGGDARD